MICKNCIYFSPSEDEPSKGAGFGVCASGFITTNLPYDEVVRSNNNKLFADADDDFRLTIEVGENFGCIYFKGTVLNKKP